MYLSTTINCESKAAAISKAMTMAGHIIVHENKDGSATINVLQYDPVQHGQAPFLFLATVDSEPTNHGK